MNNLVCNDTFDQDVRFLIRIYIFVNSTNLEVFLRWCAYIRTFTISHEKLKKCALEKRNSIPDELEIAEHYLQKS